jgi:hypothetical protein
MKVDVKPLTIVGIEAEIRMFEERYGLPSNRLADTFVEGEPTEEQLRWSMLYTTLQAARGAASRTARP